MYVSVLGMRNYSRSPDACANQCDCRQCLSLNFEGLDFGLAPAHLATLCLADSMRTVMNLQAIIMDSLQANAGHALTFDDVVKCVAERLEGDIRATLNDLTDRKWIERHVGGRDHPWRYGAPPIERRI